MNVWKTLYLGRDTLALTLTGDLSPRMALRRDQDPPCSFTGGIPCDRCRRYTSELLTFAGNLDRYNVVTAPGLRDRVLCLECLEEMGVLQ